MNGNERHPMTFPPGGNRRPRVRCWLRAGCVLLALLATATFVSHGAFHAQDHQAEHPNCHLCQASSPAQLTDDAPTPTDVPHMEAVFDADDVGLRLSESAPANPVRGPPLLSA
jgi:hypothetical protein